MALTRVALAAALLVVIGACGGTGAGGDDPTVASFCEIYADIEKSAPAMGSSGTELETVW